jgi:hypothetical protein
MGLNILAEGPECGSLPLLRRIGGKPFFDPFSEDFPFQPILFRPGSSFEQYDIPRNCYGHTNPNPHSDVYPQDQIKNPCEKYDPSEHPCYPSFIDSFSYYPDADKKKRVSSINAVSLKET